MTALAAAGVLTALLAGAYAVAVLDRVFSRRRREFSTTLLSPILDASTLLRSESIVPRGADRLLFDSAPVVALAAIALAALVLPLSPGLVALDPSIGIFYFMVCLGPFVVALMNAGWAANAKTGLLGTFRAAAILLAYEVPFGFAAIGPAMAAESLSTVSIVQAQANLWFVVWQPLGFAIYIVAALMIAVRRPFDIAHADTEVAGGVLAEYSGARLLLWRVVFDSVLIAVAAMGTVLFLGGWHGPVLPRPVWFALKTMVLATLLLGAGRRFPRLRHDQMLAIAWKVLLPASLVNVAWVGVGVLLQR